VYSSNVYSPPHSCSLHNPQGAFMVFIGFDLLVSSFSSMLEFTNNIIININLVHYSV